MRKSNFVIDGIEGKIKDRSLAQQRKYDIHKWRDAGVDPLFFESTLDNYEILDHRNQKPLLIIKAYAQKIKERIKSGKGLILTGEVGIGKSHLASCLLKEALKYYLNCKMISSAELIELMKDSMDDHNLKDEVNDILDSLFLVVDEFLLDRTTEWSRERIYNLINYRYKAKLATVFVTNLELGEMKNEFGDLAEQAISRLLFMSIILHFYGDDYRISVVKERMKEKGK